MGIYLFRNMSRDRIPANGGIPRFTITLPKEEDLGLLGALRAAPGVESTCVFPTEGGTKVTIIGASYEEALKHMTKKAAIALERIRLEETMKAEEDSEEGLICNATQL